MRGVQVAGSGTEDSWVNRELDFVVHQNQPASGQASASSLNNKTSFLWYWFSVVMSPEDPQPSALSPNRAHGETTQTSFAFHKKHPYCPISQD
jgi:hypothetical protein